MSNEENILKELWLGNIYPMEKILKDAGAEIDNISKEIDRLHFEIADSIKDDKLFSKFNTYENLHGKYENEICEKSFEMGFSLATRIMSSAFNKE